MSREQVQAALRRLVEAREVKAKKQEALRKKKSAEERGKRCDEHHDQGHGPEEAVPTLLEDEPLRYSKRKAEDDIDKEADQGQHSAKKAKTDKIPIYRDRKSKSGKLSNATMQHLNALRTRKQGNGPVEPTFPPYVFQPLTDVWLQYTGTMATTQSALTKKDPNTHRNLKPPRKGRSTRTPSRLPTPELSTTIQKELDRQTVGPVGRSVANTQRAVSGDVSGPERKRKRGVEDEPLADDATAPSAKKVKLDDGHKPVECPKTEMTTNSSQIKTKAAGQRNLNSAVKRPWSLGGTGENCPQVGKDTKVTREITVENEATCNEGAQDAIPRITPKPGPFNRQTQGQQANPQGKESGLPPPNPVGLQNFHFACYANTTIQALARSPEFSEHYRALAAAHGINAKVAAFVTVHAVDLEKPGRTTKCTRIKRGGLRNFLEKHKEEICLGAYLGDLLQKLHSGAETGEAPSSFLFLQACATVLEHGADEPFNGEGPEECSAFLERLLERLELEELMARASDQIGPSLVRKLFGVESQQMMRCSRCQISRDSAMENAFFLQVEVPKDKEIICITDCLKRYSDPVAVEWRCTTCGKTDASTKFLHITKLAPYTFINIVRGIQDKYGNHIKNMARVTLPVSSRMNLATKEASVPFQLIAAMTHHGPKSRVDAPVNVASPLPAYSFNHVTLLMETILNGLNAAQHDAVTSPANVLQVLAPPGSGKTKTLTSRVAYLLRHDRYRPWNVICLTFTIKSSREMKGRISKLIGNGIESKLILGTFHSVCRRYLVTYGHLIGIHRGFGIADSTDTTSIIKRVIKRLGLTIDPKKAQSRISSSKSRGLTHTVLGQQEATRKDVEQQEFAVVFGAYENQLAQSNLLDYDDLLLRSVDLLRQHPSCVSNVEAVLIDEFQDTNLVQFDLMRLFAAKHKRITTVGDPDQSIYGWRSAEIENLKRMQKQYPDTLVIHLEDNYRSSAAILLAAQAVIEQDESRPSKSLLPTHCPGTVPVLRRLPSADIEAQWIVSEIFRVTGLTGNLLTYSDFAILLRSASLSRQVEAAMGKAGIAYRMVGGQRFFDRVEIKILLDYLRVMSQPHNNDALFRILNIPARGVGTTTAKGLLEEAEMRRVSLWIHIRDAIQGHGTVRTKISKTLEHGLGSFINIILTARKTCLDSIHPQSPVYLLRYIIKKLNFKTYLHKHYNNDHESRWTNVEELIAQAAEYPVSGNDVLKGKKDDDRLPKIEGLDQEIGNAAEEALAKFLANVALATELQREDEELQDGRPLSQVTISTIHAAKGLEWPVVFVPSAYDGCIPHSRAENIDEERRLLYVAMTRAQALLYMSCPKKNSQREETTLSSFLSTKKVAEFLINKGPTVDLDTVEDISRILRRGSPSMAEVVEGSKKLQKREDSLWPLNGEEDHESLKARWSKWDLDTDNEQVSKRRRLEVGRKENGAVVVRSAYMLSSIGSATTMQSSSAFSCNGSGFISAASQLHHVEQEKAMTARVKGLTSEGRCPTSIASNSKARSTPEDQGNLMTLWGKSGKPNVDIASRVSLDVPQEDLYYQTAVKASLALAVQPSNSRILSTKRKSLSAISQRPTSHRLPANMSSTRPYLTTDEAGHTKEQYIFLSSSPPPVEELLEATEVENKGTLQHDATQAAMNVRPAKTFHMTSVTQLQEASPAPTRTLGVRRSMKGWAARTNHGFSVPRLTGPKP